MLLYGLKNFKMCDSWYCKEGDTYHGFFLQITVPGKNQKCAHVTSKDLIHWDYQGVVLEGEEGTWNDDGIATGSVVKHEGRWYMLYTGMAKRANTGGIGVAVSDDLMTWKKVGNGPVIKIDCQKTEYGMGYPFEWNGETVYCHVLADPYVYPEPIDGEYYIFINSQAVGYPFNRRAAMAIFKTRDFKTFTPHKLATLDDCDRIETCQVWKHGDKYYMYGGRVWAQLHMGGEAPQGFTDPLRVKGWDSGNWIFVSDSIDGPYEPIQELQFMNEVMYPNGRYYIGKVVEDLEGKEVMLFNYVPYGVMGPFPVHYMSDNTILLEYKNISV